MHGLAAVLWVPAVFVWFLGCSLNSEGLSGKADSGKTPAGDASIRADANTSPTGGRGGQAEPGHHRTRVPGGAQRGELRRPEASQALAAAWGQLRAGMESWKPARPATRRPRVQRPATTATPAPSIR